VEKQRVGKAAKVGAPDRTRAPFLSGLCRLAAVQEIILASLRRFLGGGGEEEFVYLRRNGPRNRNRPNPKDAVLKECAKSNLNFLRSRIEIAYSAWS